MSVVTSSTSIGFALVAPFMGLIVDRFGLDSLAAVCTAAFAAAAAVMSRQLRGVLSSVAQVS